MSCRLRFRHCLLLLAVSYPQCLLLSLQYFQIFLVIIRLSDSVSGFSSIARKFDDSVLDAFIAQSPLAVKFASGGKEGVRNSHRVREEVP